jgi:hypothetical protein
MTKCTFPVRCGILPKSPFSLNTHASLCASSPRSPHPSSLPATFPSAHSPFLHTVALAHIRGWKSRVALPFIAHQSHCGPGHALPARASLLPRTLPPLSTPPPSAYPALHTPTYAHPPPLQSPLGMPTLPSCLHAPPSAYPCSPSLHSPGSLCPPFTPTAHPPSLTPQAHVL